jgi:hypothetical protein
MIRTFIVKSSDGVQFSVANYARSAAQAQVAELTTTHYAAGKTAAELTAHGDFHRVGTTVADPAPTLPMKPGLRLIQGGLSAREYGTIEHLLADREIVLI